MAWDIVYYRSSDGSIPGVEFLDGCPTKVAAHLLAVLDAVAESPPPQYSGGGKWEAVHGSMAGYCEVRATGPGREQFRLFCILENVDLSELSRRGSLVRQSSCSLECASRGGRRSATVSIAPFAHSATTTARASRDGSPSSPSRRPLAARYDGPSVTGSSGNRAERAA